MLKRRALLAMLLLGPSFGNSGCLLLLAERTSQAQHQAALSFIKFMFTPDRCCRHGSHDCCDCDDERAPEPAVRVAPVLGPQTASPVTVDRHGKLRTRAAYPGGYLHALAKPERSSTQVVLSLRPAAPFAPAPCGATLYRDGERIVVRELVRASDHEVLVALDASVLRDLDRSIRFGGTVCGREIAIDDVGRETLSMFEVRFREQLAVGAHSIAATAR